MAATTRSTACIPDDFARQLDWLLDNGHRTHPRSMDTPRMPGQRPTGKPVAITFDDGDVSNIEDRVAAAARTRHGRGILHHFGLHRPARHAHRRRRARAGRGRHGHRRARAQPSHSSKTSTTRRSTPNCATAAPACRRSSAATSMRWHCLAVAAASANAAPHWRTAIATCSARCPAPTARPEPATGSNASP